MIIYVAIVEKDVRAYRFQIEMYIFVSILRATICNKIVNLLFYMLALCHLKCTFLFFIGYLDSTSLTTLPKDGSGAFSDQRQG